MDLTGSGPCNRRGSRAAISSSGQASARNLRTRSDPREVVVPIASRAPASVPPDFPSVSTAGGRGKPHPGPPQGAGSRRRCSAVVLFGGCTTPQPFIHPQLLECLEGRGNLLPAEGGRSQRHWIKQLPGTELVRMGWWCRELQRGLGVWRWWVRIAQCEGTASRECFLELWRFEACSGPRFPRFSVEAE